MPLRPRSFLPTIFLILLAAFLADFGNLLTETLAPPKTHHAQRPRGAARSGDDGGFSITLSSPREPYLLGPQSIAIDPTVPSGDAIDQVDIFVDGRLVFTDRQPPYAYDTDFGETIRQHVIVASAVTRVGRRAKVSFVSRSGDLTETASRPVTILPAIVRDATGHPVDDLSVSDFTLFENGTRQRIVHFDNRPAPASIAVLLADGGASDAERQQLLEAAVAFTGRLPVYQALAVVDTSAPPAREAQAGRGPKSKTGAVTNTAKGADAPPAGAKTLEFSYGREAFLKRLDQAATAITARARPLGEAIQAAVEGLKARGDRRVLLLLLAGPQASDDPSLPAALEGVKKAQVTLQVLALGEMGDAEPYAGLSGTAGETGGEMVTAPDAVKVEGACHALTESLLHQYLIGYLPEARDKTGWRAIELRVRKPDLKIQARKGYSLD